jgi:hypothetical protein
MCFPIRTGSRTSCRAIAYPVQLPRRRRYAIWNNYGSKQVASWLGLARGRPRIASRSPSRLYSVTQHNLARDKGESGGGSTPATCVGLLRALRPHRKLRVRCRRPGPATSQRLTWLISTSNAAGLSPCRRSEACPGPRRAAGKTRWWRCDPKKKPLPLARPYGGGASAGLRTCLRPSHSNQRRRHRGEPRHGEPAHGRTEKTAIGAFDRERCGAASSSKASTSRRLRARAAARATSAHRHTRIHTIVGNHARASPPCNEPTASARPN